MDLPFILKKALEALLYPSGLIFVFLFLSFITSLSRYRRSQTRFFLILAFLLFYISATFLPGRLLGPLEDGYPRPSPEVLEKAEAIVLLPSYVSDRPGLSLLDRLGGETAKRLLAALLLQRKLPGKTLFIVGAGSKGGPGASYLAEIAEKLGFKKIVTLDNARDTASSARALKSHLKGKKFILVTAAYHLPRAVFLFKKEGLSPIPYPAYRVSAKEKKFSLYDLWPRPINLFYADLAVHEYLGLAFYYLMEHIPFQPGGEGKAK